jgi:trk system potassium uptake protein
MDLHRLEPPMNSIVIAGGGHVGKRLAMALEKNHQIKVIEYNLNRVKKISAELEYSVVLYGDATDESLLQDEMVGQCDLFCALTDNDGANIISAALAKNLGVRKAICLLNNNSYTKLSNGTGVDVVVLPNQETLGSILKHVRKADVARVSSLCGGTAEAIEAIAHQSHGLLSVVGRRVDQINLPDGVVLGALIRNKEVIPIHHDTIFEEQDNVVMFALNKKLVKNIEGFFQRI